MERNCSETKKMCFFPHIPLADVFDSLTMSLFCNKPLQLVTASVSLGFLGIMLLKISKRNITNTCGRL